MKRLYKILLIAGCLSLLFVNFVSAYNSTNQTFDIDSYSYATPDYMVLTNTDTLNTNTKSLTITPTQTLSVPPVYTPEAPYIAETVAGVGGNNNPSFYIPEELCVAGAERNPYLSSSLNFGCRGDYDVARTYLFDTYTTQTNITIGYDEFYLPMLNTGNGTIHYDIPIYPYYELVLPQENNDYNYVRADYTFEYYTYDQSGNATVVEKTEKVLCWPYRMDYEKRVNYYIIPIIPIGGVSSTPGFLSYNPEFYDDGNYKISDFYFTNFVTNRLDGIHRAYDPSHPTSISKFTDYRMGIILPVTVKADYRRAVIGGYDSDVIFTRNSYLGTNYTHSYTDSFYQENYDIRFGASLAGRVTDDTTWISWLIDSIQAFLDIRLGQNFTIGTVSIVTLSITTVILILKFFAGG